MPTPKVTGVCPIITTPFDDRGEVDFESLRSVIQWIGRAGCHGATLFGIAGEYYKLADNERRAMAELTVEECRKAGVASIVSVTDHATEVAVKRAKEWQDLGADCVMLLPPFFLKPNADQLCAHMIAVAQAVSIPVMLQYAPEQTGVAIPAETLAAIRNEVDTPIIYKIENRPPGRTISRMLELTGGETDIFVGNAGFQLVEGLDRGAVGAMPGCSMCDVYVRICELYQTDRRATIELHSVLLTVLNHIRQNVEQIIYYEKRILVERGVLKSAYCRRPTFTPDETMDAVFSEVYQLIEPHLIEAEAK